MPLRERRRSRITQAMTIAVTAVVVAFGVSLIWVLVDDGPEPFTALTFTDQEVVAVGPDGVAEIPVVSGFQPPAVLVGEPVPVRGERCLSLGVETPLNVTANVWWERIEPGGERIQVLEDFQTAITEAECVGLLFSNAMPDEVIAAVYDGGRVAEVWRITGTVDPERAGARNAVWRTEPFTIVNTAGLESGAPGG